MRKEFKHFQEKLATRTRKQIFTSFYTSFFTAQTLSYYLVSVFSLILLIWYRYRNKYLIHTLEDNMPGVCLPANSLSYTTLEQELFANSLSDQSKLQISESNSDLKFSWRNQEKEKVLIQRQGSFSFNSNFEDINLYPHSLFAQVSESWEKEKTSSYKGLFRGSMATVTLKGLGPRGGKNSQQSLQKGNRYSANKTYPNTKWFQIYNREFMGFSPGNLYSQSKYAQKVPDFVTTWFHSLDELPSKLSSTSVFPRSSNIPKNVRRKSKNKGGFQQQELRHNSIGSLLKEPYTPISDKTFFQSLTQVDKKESTPQSIFLLSLTKEIKKPNTFVSKNKDLFFNQRINFDSFFKNTNKLSSNNLFEKKQPITFQRMLRAKLLFAFLRKTPSMALPFQGYSGHRTPLLCNHLTPLQAPIDFSSLDKKNYQDTSPQQLKDKSTTSKKMVAVDLSFENKEQILSSKRENQLQKEKKRRLDLHAKIQFCDKQFPQVTLIVMKERLAVKNPVFPLTFPRKMSGYKYPDITIDQVRFISSQVISKGRSLHQLENRQKKRSSVLHANFPPSLVMPLNIELCQSKKISFEPHYKWTFLKSHGLRRLPVLSNVLSALKIKGVHAPLIDRRDQDVSIETIDQAQMWNRFSADNSLSDRREDFFGKNSPQTHFRSFLKDFGFVLLQSSKTGLSKELQIDNPTPAEKQSNEVDKTPLWRSSVLRSLANFSEGWKANTRIGPMISKLQVADTMGLFNTPFETDLHLNDKKVKLQNWWIGKQLDWEGKLSGFQKVSYEKVRIESAAFEWDKMEKRPGEQTKRSFSPFKDKTLFLPSTVLKGRVRVPYVTNLEWSKLIQKNLDKLKKVKEFELQEVGESLAYPSSHTHQMYDLRLFVPRVKYQRFKQKMPTIPLSLFEYKGTQEKALQRKDFPTNTNFKFQEIQTNKYPSGHFIHNLKKNGSSCSMALPFQGYSGHRTAFFSSKKKTKSKVEIQFHYPPFAQFSSSPTTLDLFSYGGLYRNRETIYEFSDSQLGALKNKLFHLISESNNSSLFFESFFPIKSLTKLVEEGFNFAFQNKQIKGLTLLLTSSKNRKALYFQERWEPITMNSWLVVTKLFYLLWSFNLIGSLYNKYGKEFFRILLDLLGKNENITRDLEGNPDENEFRVFKSSDQLLKDVAVVDNVLLELGAVVWYFRTFKAGGISSSFIFPKEKTFAANRHAKQKHLPTNGIRETKRNQSIVKRKKPLFVPNQISNKLLLVGPPGTGKTLLVKAISGEGKVPVLVQSASMLMGNPMNDGDSKTGPERLRAVFEKARTLAPCILFIDEIDTLGGKRKKMVSSFEDTDFLTSKLLPTSVYQATFSNELIHGQDSKGSDRAENGVTKQSSPSSTMGFDRKGFYLTTHGPTKAEDNLQTEGSQGRTNLGTFFQFLVELDGLQSNQKSGMQSTTNTKLKDGVLIIGATNRPNVLDPALIRPGRFDQVFNLQLPGKQKRIEILKIYSKNLGVSDKLPWEYLAKLVEGVSPAHIAAAMNESAIKAILNNTTHTVSTIEHGIRVVTCSTKEDIKPPRWPNPERVTVANEPRTSLGGGTRSSLKYKDPFFLIRRAFYQAGKGVLYKKGLNAPSPVILSLWVQQKSRQGKTDSSFGGVSQPFLQVSSRANLETRLIGWYAGKASELLVTSSLKVEKKTFITSKGLGVSYKRKDLANSFIKKSELMHLTLKGLRLWASDLGTDELRSAGSLAESMIDSWYLYSNRIALGKWHGLASQQNIYFGQEKSYASTTSPLMGKKFGGSTKKTISSEAVFLTQLMSQTEKNLRLRSSFSFSTAQTSWYARKKNTNLRIAVFKEEKEQNKALLSSSSLSLGLHSNGMIQSRLAQVWWQNEIGHHVERSESAYSQWYRLYLPNPLYKLRNVEWISPDKYTHGNDSLKSLIFESVRFSLNWNEFYRINRDYLYHGLIVTSFEKAFALLDKNREILDCVAYYLFRRKTLREYELERILEGFED